MSHQHLGYTIELLSLANGVKARCSRSGHEILLEGYASKPLALWAAIRAISAQAIAAQIDTALDQIQSNPGVVEQITSLVQDLTNLVDNG